MKNTFKIGAFNGRKVRAFGIIALVAVIVIGLAACDNGSKDDVTEALKSFTLKGDLSGLKIPSSLTSSSEAVVSVAAYTSSTFTGTPVGKAKLGVPASASVLASRSIRGPARAVGDYTGNTEWEMPLNSLGSNDNLYFAIEISEITTIGGNVFLNQIDDFYLPVGGIPGGANFLVGGEGSDVDVFENLAIEMITVQGTFTATGVGNDDIGAFSFGRLLCFDANGAEVGMEWGTNSTPSNAMINIRLPAKAGKYSFGMDFSDGNGGYKRAPGRLSKTVDITDAHITEGSVSEFTGGTFDLTGFVFPAKVANSR